MNTLSALAILIFAQVDPSEAHRQLRQERETNLARLHDYALAGRFPKNTNHPGRRLPYFVDRFDTACAVGNLMRESGRLADVAAISAANNQVRVMEVHGGALIDWVLRSGFTQEECARVQPEYEFYFMHAEKERARVQEHLLKIEGEIRARSEASLATALRRMLDNAIDVKTLTSKDAPVLFKALKDCEPAVRIGALHAIGRLQIKAGDELSVALKDENADVRLWAAAALVETIQSPRDPKPYRDALAALVAVLKEGDENRRALAVVRMGVLAYSANQAPGRRKILDEIMEALIPVATSDKGALGAEGLAMMAQCALEMTGDRSNSEQRAGFGNAGLRLIELQWGRAAHAAVLDLEPKGLAALLKSDPAAVNSRDAWGQTLLHLAARNHWTQLDQVLASKPDVNAKSRDGRTFLHGPARAELLKLKPDLDARDGIYKWTPLHWAIHLCNIELVNALLKAGADPNAADEFGFTPLHIIANCQTPEAEPASFGHTGDYAHPVDLLREAGAKTDVKDSQGRTPIWWAQKAGFAAVEGALFKK